MPLQLVVDKLDDVPEAFRTEYEKDGEKFRLKVEGVEDVTGLKSALQKERDNVKNATKLLKKWDGVTRTPEEVAEILKKLDEEDTDLKKKNGDFDSLLKQHQTKWDTERTQLQTERDAALESERAAVVSTHLMSALTKLGATEEGIDLLPDRLAARIKYEIEDGKRAIKILQADGTPLAGSGKDGSATFEDLAKEALTKWPSLFKASGASGSGTRPNNTGGTGTLKRSEMSAKDKAEYIKKHGQNAFLKLPSK